MLSHLKKKQYKKVYIYIYIFYSIHHKFWETLKQRPFFGLYKLISRIYNSKIAKCQTQPIQDRQQLSKVDSFKCRAGVPLWVKQNVEKTNISTKSGWYLRSTFSPLLPVTPSAQIQTFPRSNQKMLMWKLIKVKSLRSNLVLLKDLFFIFIIFFFWYMNLKAMGAEQRQVISYPLLNLLLLVEI